MPPDFVDVVEATTMAPALPPPLSVVEDSGPVNVGLLSPQTEALDILTQVAPDIASSLSTNTILDMAPSEIFPPNDQKLSASFEALPSTHPLSTINTPNLQPAEMHSPQISEPVVSIENVPAVEPSSLNADIPTQALELSVTNLPEKQEQSDSTESSLSKDSSPTAANRLTMQSTEKIMTEISGLPFGPFSEEDVREVTSPSDPDEASDNLSEAMEFCSQEGDSLSKIAKDQPDMYFPSSEPDYALVISQANKTAESAEVIISSISASTDNASEITSEDTELCPLDSGNLFEVMNDQPGMESSSPDTVLANMIPETIQTNLAELRMATVLNHSALTEDASDIPPEILELCSSQAGVQPYFTEDQPSMKPPFLEAGYKNMTSEIIETNLTTSPEIIISDNLPSTKNPSNLTLPFHYAETTDKIDEKLKSALIEVVELNDLPQVIGDRDPADLGAFDAEIKIETVETSSTEIREFDSTATVSPSEGSSFLGLEDSTMVSGPFEKSSAIQKHCEIAEVTPDVNFPLSPLDNPNRESAYVDTSLMESPELFPEYEISSGKEAPSLAHDSSTILGSTLELSSTKIREVKATQEVSVSEITAVIESLSLPITTEKSDSTARNLNTNSPLVAANISPVGAERSEMSRPGIEDQTSSASTSPLSSPTLSINDVDFEFGFGETKTTNMLDLHLPAPAVPYMDSSIADSNAMPNSFELSLPEVTERFVSEAPLNDPFFSSGNENISYEFDENKSTESPGIFSSATATASSASSIDYETSAMVSNHVGMNSPEIKMEPMAIGAFPYFDTLPSATSNPNVSPKLIEQSSSIVKGEKLSPETSLDIISVADTDEFTLAGEHIQAISSYMKLEPDPIDVTQDIKSHNMRRNETSKSPRKRVRFAIKDETDDQQPPAKKLCQEVIPALDVPRTKVEDGVDDFPEKNEVAQLDSQQLPRAIDATKSIISPPSTPTDMNLDLVKTEITCVKAQDVSFSVEQAPQLSIGSTDESQKMLRTATTTFTNIRGPKVKKKFANDTIELRVGSSGKCVLAHKHILAKSPFFASLMSQYPDPKESPHAYHFQYFDTYALATIIHWLYHGNIRFIAEDYKADDIFNTTHMVKVYCLCAKLQLRSLQNLAIELLGHGYLTNKSAPTIEEIDIAYSETDQSPGLRIYLATWAQCREHAPLQKYMMAGPWDQAQFKALCKKHPDLSVTMESLNESTGSANLKSMDPRFHEICWYHHHLEGERCGVANLTFESACNGVESRISEPI
ncbi:hypothetical protein N431DRAFT_409938 [Stipitochalara longipes BDJ]|nr:hypothetical protein N431DRAFT_409938 [Stipitochalara longipes BDJ]